MLVYVRADASLQIGTGHIMRCLALAEQLQEQGHEVRFLCRDHEGHLTDYIMQKGYHVFLLQSELGTTPYSYSGQPLHEQWLGVPWEVDALQTLDYLYAAEKCIDWLIIDHYALDARYELQVHAGVKKIMVIDDLADRVHHCDLLLDQNDYRDKETRYEQLVSATCKTLVGPAYALLREEFRQAAEYAAPRDGNIRTVLLSFGGVDATGETLKTLQALEPLAREGLKLEIILGQLNPNMRSIMAYSQDIPNCHVYTHVEKITGLMIRSDLAIGSGGTMTWERCCMGLPSLIITTAYNQIRLTEHTAQTGTIVYLGHTSDVSKHSIYKQVKHMMENPDLCMRISCRASMLVDGLGTQRMIKEMVM